MTLFTSTRLLSGLAILGLGLLCTACTGLQNPASETPLGTVVPAGSVGTTSSTTAGGGSSAFNSTELQLLQRILGGTTSSASAAGSATPSLTNLKKLGLSRREIAVLSLDLLVQQGNLTTDQSFAVSLVRALLAHDSAAVEQLLIGQLFQTTGSSTGTAAVTP